MARKSTEHLRLRLKLKAGKTLKRFLRNSVPNRDAVKPAKCITSGITEIRDLRLSHDRITLPNLTAITVGDILNRDGKNFVDIGSEVRC